MVNSKLGENWTAVTLPYGLMTDAGMYHPGCGQNHFGGYVHNYDDKCPGRLYFKIWFHGGGNNLTYGVIKEVMRILATGNPV